MLIRIPLGNVDPMGLITGFSRKITKGEAINNYSSAQIIATNDWMNHYPRAMFNGHSSVDIYRKAFYQEISQLHQPIINWSVLFI